MRLTIRGMLVLVALVALLLGGVAYRQRIRARAYTLVNQDIRVRGAEANYLNAGLAREAADDAVARYVRQHGTATTIRSSRRRDPRRKGHAGSNSHARRPGTRRRTGCPG